MHRCLRSVSRPECSPAQRTGARATLPLGSAVPIVASLHRWRGGPTGSMLPRPRASHFGCRSQAWAQSDSLPVVERRRQGAIVFWSAVRGSGSGATVLARWLWQGQDRGVSIALVMPTLNAGPLLDEVLSAITGLRSVVFDELLAVDSGSRDGTVERLQQAGFQVKSIPAREFDHGATRDLGIASAKAEFVALLVQDATIQGRDWLEKMLEPLADPRVAGVWCRQIPRPGCQPVLARRILGWPGWGGGVTIKCLSTGQSFADLAPFDRLMHSAFDNVASVVRRSVWERFPLGPRRFGEDVFFGKRVIEAGLALAHHGGTSVMHSHSRSAWAEGRRTFCDHRNLRDLFGLVGIPSISALRGALRTATPEHLSYVRSLGLPPAEEAEALRWTADYVRWQCWGQYLGAKAGANVGGVFGWALKQLGRRLERGIG